MRAWDSDLLREISRIFRLSGPVPDGIELQDELVQTGVDIGPVARRGGAIGPRASQAGDRGLVTDGYMSFRLNNVHAVGDTQQSSVNPYELAATGSWPGAEIADKVDIWLVSFGARPESGAANFTRGSLHYQGDAAMDMSGTASVPQIMFADFQTAVTQTTPNYLGIGATPGQTQALLQPLPWRIPVLGDLLFTTETSGAAEFNLWLLFGIFPLALGQDVGS